MRILSRQHPKYINVIIDDTGTARPRWAVSHPLLQEYFDEEWGRPVRDEQGLFERLSLESFQAGLSWLTILKKRTALRQAFDQFDPEIITQYTDDDVERLMTDVSIVRNRQKILAVINNAQATVSLRDSGGLAKLIWSYQPELDPKLDADGNPPSQSEESVALAKELKRHGFRFVGPTTVFAMMEAIGVVNTFPFREPRNLSNTPEARYG
ncbi:DNA-3-methyladenine glycosylase I [Enteractinococcus coprophilus]|uniref:DNA-3-methyladenine glycosylase I n=1 Tax=Enteractinococcus coprophilus TaxID=1027633 RepID=A0A543AFA2_9MICC|nr:DNA-3-methyladenine glycosylase I [Enteractinococcus coprophilus]